MNKVYLQLAADNVILDSENNTVNKNVPYAINLFSSAVMSNKNTAVSILPNAVNTLFAGDELRFTSYSFYSYLLNIFGKVHYLRGFTQRQEAAFGDDFNKFLNTTKENNRFIKDMDWRPLTLDILNNIPTNKQILCKVDWFEGDKISSLLDEKIINLYEGYFNYNELFFISGPRIGLLEPATEIDSTVADLAEVPKTPLGPQTREQVSTLNREFVQTLISQDRQQRESIDSTVDDTSTKIIIDESSSREFTFTKPKR